MLDGKFYFQGAITIKSMTRKDGSLDLALCAGGGPRCPVPLPGVDELYKRPMSLAEMDLGIYARGDNEPYSELDAENPPTADEYFTARLLQEQWTLASVDPETGEREHWYEAKVRVEIEQLVADDHRAQDWLIKQFFAGEKVNVSVLRGPTRSERQEADEKNKAESDGQFSLEGSDLEERTLRALVRVPKAERAQAVGDLSRHTMLLLAKFLEIDVPEDLDQNVLVQVLLKEIVRVAPNFGGLVAVPDEDTGETVNPETGEVN